MTQTNINLNNSKFPDAGAGVGGDAQDRLIVRLWKIGIIGTLFYMMFHPEIVRLCRSWTDSSESHGMLIPAFSLYFVFQVREELGRTVGKASIVGFLSMIGCLAAYLFAINYQYGYPKPILMILMIAAIVFALGGWRILRLVWLPILFLWFAIPLPSSIHEGITIPMRMMASSVAAVILNFFPDVTCHASGVLIHGAYKGEGFDLNVAEACSGMRLLRAFVALGVAMAYLEKRPLAHRLVLLASTIPIAILCNVIRVLLTGIIYIFVGAKYAQGTLHDMLGLVMLALAFGFYGIIAWVMNHLVIEEEEDEEEHVLKIEH